MTFTWKRLSIHKYILRCTVMLVAYLFPVCCFASQAGKTIQSADGFVTSVESPSESRIGPLNVLLTTDTKCERQPTYGVSVDIVRKWEKENPKDFTAFSWWFGMFGGGLQVVAIPCDTSSLSFGSRVRIEGVKRQDNGRIVPSRFIIYQIPPRTTVGDLFNKNEISGAALLESVPSTQSHPKTLWIDGLPVETTPQSTIDIASADTQLAYRGCMSCMLTPHLNSAHPAPRNALPANYTVPNTWVLYDATVDPNGAIVATHLTFWENHVTPKLSGYLRRFAAKIDPPDYNRHKQGSLTLPGCQDIRIIPDRRAQEWVSALGQDLVPEYQKQMQSDDPAKIDFKFYVVSPFEAMLGSYFVSDTGPMPNYTFQIWDETSKYLYTKPKNTALVTWPVALPTGTILVPDTTLANLHNTAQLAALLSYAITSVLQRQAYLAWPSRIFSNDWERKIYFSSNKDFVLDFGLGQNEQILRLGLRAMLSHGYDIREAPSAWSMASGDQVINPVLNQKALPSTTARMKPWYLAYSMAVLSGLYSNVDYSKLKRGEKEYQQFLEELYKADPTLKRPTAQTVKQ